jgi:hypothetical protein
VRVCKKFPEAAKTLSTRDHVIGISGTSTPLNTVELRSCRSFPDSQQVPKSPPPRDIMSTIHPVHFALTTSMKVSTGI